MAAFCNCFANAPKIVFENRILKYLSQQVLVYLFGKQGVGTRQTVPQIHARWVIMLMLIRWWYASLQFIVCASFVHG
jgi:hypothetical protein